MRPRTKEREYLGIYLRPKIFDKIKIDRSEENGTRLRLKEHMEGGKLFFSNSIRFLKKVQQKYVYLESHLISNLSSFGVEQYPQRIIVSLNFLL